MVHDEDEVEVVEIARFYLPGAAGEIISAPCGVAAHAGIGEVAAVPSAGAGGIDFDTVGEPFAVDELFHDSVGGG